VLHITFRLQAIGRRGLDKLTAYINFRFKGGEEKEEERRRRRSRKQKERKRRRPWSGQINCSHNFRFKGGEEKEEEEEE
jgi:hypothetical protein